MNRELVNKFIREVGAVCYSPPTLRQVIGWWMTFEQMDKFAELVEAHVREELLKQAYDTEKLLIELGLQDVILEQADQIRKNLTTVKIEQGD